MDSIKQDYKSLLANYMNTQNHEQTNAAEIKNKPLYAKKGSEYDYLDNLVLNDNEYAGNIDVDSFIKDTESLIIDKLASNKNIFELIEENKINFENPAEPGLITEDALPEINIDTANNSQITTVKTKFLAALEAKIAAKKAAI